MTLPSDINAACLEQRWGTILDSQARSRYDLRVLLPLPGAPGTDPCMENDGIRSLETPCRHALPTRSPQWGRVVQLCGSRAGRVKRLNQKLGIR
ncbi:MAG: hypothetical protein VKM34_08990 [Cyanobacteriota bacterium]|nr:hypothetical protein [Cyanobacteriota bacterium]